MLGILAALAAAASASPDTVVGRWQTENRHGVIDIVRCGRSICGTVGMSDGLRANPQLRDSKNRNAALRGRRLRGVSILSGFTWKGGAWTGGKIYNPEDGGTYSATVTIADANHLRLRGCVVWPLCKTQTWVRLR